MRDVTRLKRLLEKKRRAAMLPKAKLAEYADEYADLLERIEFEQKRLQIDADSIKTIKDTIAEQNGGRNARERLSKELAELIKVEERAIDRAARVADLDDLEYHKSKLAALWKRTAVTEYEQLTLNTKEQLYGYKNCKENYQRKSTL